MKLQRTIISTVIHGQVANVCSSNFSLYRVGRCDIQLSGQDAPPKMVMRTRGRTESVEYIGVRCSLMSILDFFSGLAFLAQYFIFSSGALTHFFILIERTPGNSLISVCAAVVQVCTPPPLTNTRLQRECLQKCFLLGTNLQKCSGHGYYIRW